MWHELSVAVQDRGHLKVAYQKEAYLTLQQLIL